MAAAGRGQGVAVIDGLRREAYRFDFFQAMRVLERWLAHEADGRGVERRMPVGYDAAPNEEIVRLRALVSMTFPPSPIAELREMPPAKNADGLDDEAAPRTPPFEMVCTFMGLIGAAGVLPTHFTTMLIERVRDKDEALRDWFDLFHHRTISLFYRAWEKHHFPFAYERSRLEALDRPSSEPRASASDGIDVAADDADRSLTVAAQTAGVDDLFTRALFSLVGLGTGGLRGRLRADDEAFLFYGGHFAHLPRNAEGLEQVLGDYFGITVEVRQFQGQWLYLSPQDCSQMSGIGGANNELGRTTVVGHRVWDVQSRFRIRTGPLKYQQFQRLTPNGDGLRSLCEVTRLYVGGEFEFDVQPVLLASEIPTCQLGSPADEPRLGWNTFLSSGPQPADFDGAVFHLDDV